MRRTLALLVFILGCDSGKEIAKKVDNAVTKLDTDEAARAEQPEAPALTECSSDEWPKAKTTLDRDFGAEPRWTDLKARWAKVCPGA
jgi:hypothetical protein